MGTASSQIKPKRKNFYDISGASKNKTIRVILFTQRLTVNEKPNRNEKVLVGKTWTTKVHENRKTSENFSHSIVEIKIENQRALIYYGVCGQVASGNFFGFRSHFALIEIAHVRAVVRDRIFVVNAHQKRKI